jgi:uncharacterized membrane protein YhiD involved in acid resistance
MDPLTTTILAIVAILAVIGLYHQLDQQLKDADQQVRATVTKVRELVERMQKLEADNEKLKEANHYRINFDSLQELDNATAVLSALDDQMELRREFVHNALEHMRRARNPKRNGR